MEDLIRQIRAASAASLYYLALSAALAITDICSALETENGKATPARYKAWFDRHGAPKCNAVLDGNTCYLFRCSMLHQDTTQEPVTQYLRVLFVEPGDGAVSLEVTGPAGTEEFLAGLLDAASKICGRG